MKKQFKQLVRLFSQNENISFEYIETWDCVDIEASIVLENIPAPTILLQTIPLVSYRDLWELNILDESGDSILVLHSSSGEIYDSLQITAYKDLTISLKFIITKNIKNHYLSVYNIYEFAKYLNEASLYSFFNALNNRLKDTLIIECINDQIETLCTSSIAIVPKGEIYHPMGINDKIKRIHSSEVLIHWGTYKLQLLPEDIYSRNDKNPMYQILNKSLGCLLVMYLFDYVVITEDTLNVKLCGFKSLNYTFNISNLSKINIDKETIIQLFEVYRWGMSGGYIPDKFSIVRNILSLNLEISNIKLISPIIDSIKSNFRVYEKENVQQYIQLRNEISNLLIDLQTKINDIVQNFTTDFKNNFLALISFFISVVVLGVISDASPLIYFSNHIIILSWCFLGISLCYWLYSYNELNKRTKLFHKHYKQIKDRYAALLDETELETVFEECNPDKYESHRSYLEWQKCKFSLLWIGSILTLSIGLLILFVSNNTSIFENINNILNIIIQCCLKNI